MIEVSATGTLAVDYFALLPKLIGADEKIISSGYEIHPGGVSGNVLTQLARLGVSAGWFGKVGNDEAGKILIDEFKNEGVDCSHLEVVDGDFSMMTWIQVDKKGGRSIIMFPNVLAKLTAEEIEKKHGDYIRASKAMHAEACLLPLKPVLKAMEIAKESGVKVVFDLDVPPSYFVDEAKMATRDELMRALEMTDVLIPCKSSAIELLNTDDITGNAKKLLDFGPEVVAITLGDKGCIVFDEKNFFSVPAFNINVVDTTGAGDAFHGGFIYSILKGFSLEESGRFANACGALCCIKVGARAMGRLDDIKKLLEQSQ